MKRPIYILAAFLACLGVVAAALVWVSMTVIRLDRAEKDARVVAAIEENVRLALWRMDSKMAAFIALENSRPYFHYSAFYPEREAYNRAFSQYRPGEVLVPSPLLSDVPERVILYFQLSPDGALTSPQVPQRDMRAATGTNFASPDGLARAEARLAQLAAIVNPASFASLNLSNALSVASPSPEVLVRVGANANSEGQPGVTRNAGSKGQQGVAYSQTLTAQSQQYIAQQAVQQELRNDAEWQARFTNVENQGAFQRKTSSQDAVGNLKSLSGSAVKPLWISGELVLARRVDVNERPYIQGCWLDWPAIEKWLLADVGDLLPRASLRPSSPDSPGRPSRMLASLPVELVPGEQAVGGDGVVSPVLYSLFVAWAAVLLAVAGAAGLVWAAVSLSIRRGAFVSAVTHELRTPLTTFSLYAEMLAEGMVPEEKIKDYLQTLLCEAERLSHLVENVLAYARVENRAAKTIESVAISELLDKIMPRLSDRAAQAGMELVVEPDAAAAPRVRVDHSAVERILFNLVDNASKYASSSADKRIHVRAAVSGSYAVISVADHGPGIAPGAARRIFSPFSKSARDAANSAPGIGLGLSLSRRLARNLGGELTLDPAEKNGACFTLRLPLS